MNETPAIRLHDLTKTFSVSGGSTVTAVDGIDLSIRAGEVVAFLGPNGAGKTSTIDMILGLSRPDSGSVEVFGQPARSAARNGRVAAVMQTGGLLNDYTVAETVRVIASLHHRLDQMGEVMDRAGLTEIADRKVSRCSGGEQQRLKFALALLPDPDLIVLDEPTAGMDVESRRAFWATMRADAQAGRTVVFATHYLEEADAFADRVVMIAHGKIVADGSTSQIRARAGGRIVSAVMNPDALPSVLATVSGVQLVEQRGGRVYLSASNSDVLLRHLLNDTDAHDLEVASHNLEDAFVALTSHS
ncbi:MAG: ABC transporter ATP-binding protein [Gordonia sp. (in: high G+C Gram-positive bacteria)]